MHELYKRGVELKNDKYTDTPFRHVSAVDLINIGYDFMFMSDHEISHPKEVFLCGEPVNIETFHKQLYLLGIDISFGIGVECVIHRPCQTGKQTLGFRFFGLERTDKPWIESPFASYEAKICSSGMSDMHSVVKTMSENISEKVADRMFYNKSIKKNKNKTKYRKS